MTQNTKMRVALVHDFLREYGGAERVLRKLADMYPDATIYTAFTLKGSTAEKKFTDRKVVESWLAPLLKIWRFYSVFRFTTPLVWMGFDLSEYDLVITSASWYITRGMRVGPNTKVVCYCHTPPRWLYGLETAGDYQKYWPVKIYAAVNKWLLTKYDKWSAKTVDYWIANSETVKRRIKRFYGVSATVIYPPVVVAPLMAATRKTKKQGYFLIVSRLTGGKGIEEAVTASEQGGFKLKISGEAVGSVWQDKAKAFAQKPNVELLGRVSDKKLYGLYAGATGFIALARDEDFGITPVEAMAAGTPVLAMRSGGFRESVVEGKTGVFVDSTNPKEISQAVKKIQQKKWDQKVLQTQARRFSEEMFVKQIKEFIAKITK